MSDLITWLRGVLDEDERTALLIPGGGYQPARWTAHRVPDGEWSEIRQHDLPVGAREDDWAEVSTAGLMIWGRNEDEHVARYDPAWVVVDIAAKRAILDAYDAPTTAANVAEEEGLILAVRLLASAYADRPGYREEWRP